MNEKGFMLVELLVSIMVVSFFLFTLIKIPVNLTRSYTDYIEIADEVVEEYKLKTAILSDLREFGASENNGNLVVGSDNIYRFSNEGVYRERNGVEHKLTNNIFNFSIQGNTLIIKGEDKELKYIINSSFKKYNK